MENAPRLHRPPQNPLYLTGFVERRWLIILLFRRGLLYAHLGQHTENKLVRDAKMHEKHAFFSSDLRRSRGISLGVKLLPSRFSRPILSQDS